MDIVDSLINASKFNGIEREEFLKANLKKISKNDVMFISFILGVKIGKLNIKNCNNVKVFLGREHFMYNFINYNKVNVEYLTPTEVKVINILKRDNRLPHLLLLSHMEYIMSITTLTLELQDIIEKAQIALKGVSENGILSKAYMSSTGRLLTHKKFPCPINLNPTECVVYTDTIKLLAHGNLLLYNWVRGHKRLLPPEVLKLHKHKSYLQSRKGKYDFIFTFENIESRYVPLDIYDCEANDWVIDEECFTPIGVRFIIPIGVKFSNVYMFERIDIKDLELSMLQVRLHVNENSIVKHHEIIIKH